MSTRCNIILEETNNNNEFQIWLYRHSDGYPSGVFPTLSKFIQYMLDGFIKKDISQSSGWLILLGIREHLEIINDDGYDIEYIFSPVRREDWEVGNYIVTSGIHGDIEYLYALDYTKQTITINDIKMTWRQFINLKPRNFNNEGDIRPSVIKRLKLKKNQKLLDF